MSLKLRFKFWFLALALYIFMAGCGGNDKNPITTSSNENNSAQSIKENTGSSSETGVTHTEEVPVIKESIEEILERESKQPTPAPEQRVIPFHKGPPPTELPQPEAPPPPTKPEPETPSSETNPKSLAPQEKIALALAPSLANNFSGLDDNNTKIPPDTHGAAGPSHLMETLNSEVAFFNKSTGALLSKVTLQAFWASLGTGAGQPANSPFDPKVIYDQYSGRFIFVTMGGNSSPNSWVLLAVSATSDPTGTWYKWYIDADREGATQTSNWADYPGLGIDADNIYISANMYNSSNVFQYSKLYVIPKTQVFSSGTSFYYFSNPTGSGVTLQPAHTFGTSSVEYIIHEGYFISGTPPRRSLRLAKITFSAGTPTWTDMGYIEVASYPTSGFPDAPQLGSLQTIETNDSRLLNAVFRNGYLWTTHTVTNNTNTKTEIAWYQINPSLASSTSPYGTPFQQGRISNTSRWYYFPSIAVNLNNDVGIGFSGSSSSEYPSAYYTARSSTETSGTMQSVAVLKAGLASYYKTFSGTKNRWGDYSATSIDPDDDLTFWTLQEYASTPSTSDKWGTWWGKFSLLGDTSPPSNTTVTNFINSGATYINSTSVTLSISATDSVGVTGYYASETSTTPSASAIGWTSVTSTTSYSADVSFTLSSGDGTKTVYVWFKDAAGNVSTTLVSDTIILDTTAPSNASVSINSGASSTSSTSVTLSISATDSVGVTGYYASETSTTPSASAIGWTSVTSTTSYLADVSFTLSSGDGTKTVYVWFKDAVGNVSTLVSDTITLSTPTSGGGGGGGGGGGCAMNPNASPDVTLIGLIIMILLHNLHNRLKRFLRKNSVQ